MVQRAAISSAFPQRRTTSILRLQNANARAHAPMAGGAPTAQSPITQPVRPSRPVGQTPVGSPAARPSPPAHLQPGARPFPHGVGRRDLTTPRAVGPARTAADANRQQYARFGAVRSAGASGVTPPSGPPSSIDRAQPRPGVPQPQPVASAPVTATPTFGAGVPFGPRPTLSGTAPGLVARQPIAGAQRARPGAPAPAPTAPQIGTSRSGLQAAERPPISDAPQGTTPVPADQTGAQQQAPAPTQQPQQGQQQGTTAPPGNLPNPDAGIYTPEYQAWEQWAAALEEKPRDQWTDDDWSNWVRWQNFWSDSGRTHTRTTNDGWTYNQSNITGGFGSISELASALGTSEEAVRDLLGRGYTFHRGMADDQIRVKTPSDRVGNEVTPWEVFQTTPTFRELDERVGTTRETDGDRTSADELRSLFEQFGGDQVPEFDEAAIEELILRQRQAHALSQAQNVQALMERGARAGVSPEAMSGMIANASHAASVAQHQEEARLRLAQVQTQFEAKMREYENARQAALELLRMSHDEETRREAMAHAQRMAVLQSHLQRQYARFQMELQQPTSGDIFSGLLTAAGTIGGAIIGGPAGAAAGGLGGRALGAAAFG